MFFHALFNITFSLVRKFENYLRISLLIPRQRSVFVLKVLLFALIFTVVLVGSSSLVWAAQLDARINPNSPESKIEIKYQRTVFIEYPEGGNIADDLRGKTWEIKVIADFSDPGVQELVTKLNQKLTADGSSARITDANLDYSARLTGRGINTSVDYKIILTQICY